MGKKKLSKVVEWDDDCSSSTSTDASSSSQGCGRDDESYFEQYVDLLYEKRASSREAGLKGLISILTADVRIDLIERKYETLSHNFLVCVRRGASSEAVLASRALGLISLTAGAGEMSEHVLKEAFPHLVKLCKTGGNAEARIAAVESLAILTFVGSGDDTSVIENAMEVFWQIYFHKGNEHANQTLGTAKPTTALKAVAITAWSLLLSILTPERIISTHLSSSLSVFSSLLEVQDLGLRKATGEAIALLHESSNASAANSDSEDEWQRVDESEVVGRMKELAGYVGKEGQTRKDRSEQRRSFRKLLAAVEGGVCEQTAVSLQRGGVLRVNTWAQTIQLNALRKFLATGFQKHLQSNSLLHEVFGFVPQAGHGHEQENGKLSKVSKRIYMSPNSVASKQRTLARKKQMDQAAKHQATDFGNDDS